MSSALERGRGRGRGHKKRAKTEALPVAPSGAVDADEGLAIVHRSMLATPLGALMRIEATIWMNARGGGHMSIDDFFALAQSHGWLGLNKKVNSNGGTDETKIIMTTPKIVSKLSNDVYELIRKLTEEERLIFDFVAVSAWEPEEIPNLYPLYRLHSPQKGNIRLEILQQPRLKETKSATATAKSNTKIATRSEVLGSMYNHSHKCFSFSSKVGNPCALQNWWVHAKGVAQIIIDHRESKTASTRKVESSTGNPSFKSLMTNHADAVPSKSQTKQHGEKKMTLEERVRARSLRNPTTVNSKQVSKTGNSLQENRNKALLELADALRSYSQRRGLVSSGGGGSALDRLRNRGSGCTNATKNIARLTVVDLLKDARMTWNSVVNESIDQHDDSGGNKSRLGGAMTVVNIDLSRVLFQLRLKMLSAADVSDRRQMELQLIRLLEELTTLVPKWMSLLKAPSTLSDQHNAATSNHMLNIRQSIIIIRNDSVNYAMDVRAKLGGRVYNPADLAMQSSSGKKAAVSKCNKRYMYEQQLQNKVQGHVGVADVPPSFRRMYGKALGLEEESKK
mmetsp:Transcript_20075/g.43553  ORF Transcript_20075/g.43553 Transcript_20075/m.43553 type:complete len:565 (-) Transcript_20075:142-1836(-)